MGDDADQERFERLRYVELKHGRVSMLAFLGQIWTRAGNHLGGNIDTEGHSFDSSPNGIAAVIGPDAIPQAGLVQIFAFVGDFRNGAIDFGWDKFDEETKFAKRAIELNNGRAAMMGILGLMIHEELGTNLPVIGQM